MANNHFVGDEIQSAPVEKVNVVVILNHIV